MNSKKYERINPMTRTMASIAFASQKHECIINALLSLTYYDPDWKYIQDICISYLTDDDFNVRRVAIECLGNIAIFHKKLDVDIVVSALKKQLLISPYSGYAENSLNDIAVIFGSSAMQY